MCGTCTRPQPDGSVLCPECASGRVLGLATPEPSRLVVAAACQRHPEVAAVATCVRCQARVCETCDFSFPGGLHLCPVCATSSSAKVSDKRRRTVLWGYALAAWSTLGTFAMLVASVAATSKDALEAIGLGFGVLVFLPALVGAALSLGALDRRLANPPWVWGAAVWNCVIVGGLFLLSLIGTLKG